MDNIYDTLAKLNEVANRPEAKEIVKEDSHGMMKKGLRDLIDKSSKMNKQADYKPFGKDDKDYEDGLAKDAKKDKMFDDKAAADASKMNKQSTYTPFSDKQSPDGLPEKKKDNKMFEKESDVERDDRAEKAGREVAHDAKYDGRDHAGKDGKDVTKDIEYDEKHDKDGMHEADINEISNKTIDSYMDKVGQEDGHEQDMETASSKREKGIDLATAKQLGNAKVKATENAGTLKDAARAGVMARLAELAGLPAKEIEEALGDSPQDTASRIMSEVSLDESDIDQIADVGKVYSKINKMKMDLVDKGMEPEDAQDEACEKYDCDPAMYDKYVEMKRDDREKVKEEDTNEGNEFSGALEKAKKDGKAEFEVDGKKYKVEAIDSDEDAIQEGGGRDMECGHCDGTGKHGDKDCKKCDGTGEEQEDDDPLNNESKEEKVEETTSAGAVADGAGSGSSPYKNASVYESNEIVKRAKQINEDMSFTVSGGPDQEPTLNINASGEEATQLAQLLKLSGLAMTAQQPSYGEVEIQVAEDQEFANGDQNEQTADTNTLVNAISGGLNGQKKMAYPKVAGGDNPMSGLLGESELVATSANQLLKQYEAYKAK
jgi:hypothetical protein